jgi:hypothetical protein
VIPAQLADVIRYADAVLSLGLIVMAGWAAVLAEHWDQRVRFGIFAAFGFLLTSGHLNTLGQEGSWRLALLIVIVTAALWSTSVHVRREVRERDERAKRGRSAR